MQWHRCEVLNNSRSGRDKASRPVEGGLGGSLFPVSNARRDDATHSVAPRLVETCTSTLGARVRTRLADPSPTFLSLSTEDYFPGQRLRMHRAATSRSQFGTGLQPDSDLLNTSSAATSSIDFR
ncbi:unnamed protein product [Jaminaea pallidilutea]